MASVASERNSLIQPVRRNSSGTPASAINASCSIRLRWINGNSAIALCSARSGDEARKYRVSHGRKAGRSLEVVAHLRRAEQRISQDLAQIPREHVGKHRGAFDQPAIAITGFLAGRIVPVDQDHVPAAFLQVQGGAYADHARTQNENVGLQFRHSALRKFNVTLRWRAAYGEPSHCRTAAQTGTRCREMMLARRLNSGNMARQYPPLVAEIADQSGEIEQMSVRRSLLAAAMASIIALAVVPASAQSLRYANQGDFKSLDPYTLNESTTLAHLAHIFEGLRARQGSEDHSGAG